MTTHIYQILITEPAENDLREIGRYIARELLEPALAEKMVSKIGDAIIGLEQMPLRNALVADEVLAARGIRKLLVDNYYIVFYVVSEKAATVTIVRILYSRRDWMNLL